MRRSQMRPGNDNQGDQRRGNSSCHVAFDTAKMRQEQISAILRP